MMLAILSTDRFSKTGHARIDLDKENNKNIFSSQLTDKHLSPKIDCQTFDLTNNRKSNNVIA